MVNVSLVFCVLVGVVLVISACVVGDVASLACYGVLTLAAVGWLLLRHHRGD